MIVIIRLNENIHVFVNDEKVIIHYLVVNENAKVITNGHEVVHVLHEILLVFVVVLNENFVNSHVGLMVGLT